MDAIHRKHLSFGIFLGVTFLAVLVLIFLPVFGRGRNGLTFADDLFNKLSKGSSYFIPKIMKANEKFMGKRFTVTIQADKPEEAEKIARLFGTAGTSAEAQGSELRLDGDLGRVVETVLRDSDAMYQNQGSRIASAYGMDEKEAMKLWWQALDKMNKAFTKEKRLEEAKLVSDTNKKAVETAYNYYGIEAQKVTEKAVLMTGLLIFYVIYTLWWGFSIFYIFEGIGLTMKKAKVKKEI